MYSTVTLPTPSSTEAVTFRELAVRPQYVAVASKDSTLESVSVTASSPVMETPVALAAGAALETCTVGAGNSVQSGGLLAPFVHGWITGAGTAWGDDSPPPSPPPHAAKPSVNSRLPREPREDTAREQVMERTLLEWLGHSAFRCQGLNPQKVGWVGFDHISDASIQSCPTPVVISHQETARSTAPPSAAITSAGK